MDPEQPTPTVPPAVRTWAYVVGLAAAAAVAPLALAGLDVLAAIAGAVSAVGNGIAFGYRPTRAGQ